tara:strand:+ start:42 stop:1319 length:1278 start_codon:yes stop_codon:yes gene_type:complete
MKNNLLIVFTLFLIIPFATSIEIDVKTNFSQGETFVAKISGNFYEAISKENIVFKRGHVRTSIIPFVSEINNDFYIYAQLIDKEPNNYSVVIENVKYIQGNKIIEEDLEKNFSINEGFADFSVSPGFVEVDEDFFIEVKNLQDNEIIVNLNTLNESSNSEGFLESLFGGQETSSGSQVILSPGETKKINFEIEDFQELSLIELSTENLKYEIIVYAFPEDEEEKEKNFRFEPSQFDISMSTNSDTLKIIYLRNIGGEKIEDISLRLSDSLIPYVNFSVDEIDELEENSSQRVTVFIYSDEEEQNVEGQITAVSNETYAYVSVFLNFLEDFIPVDSEGNEVEFIPETCSDLNGQICGDNQQCNGNINYTTDGVCCIGACSEVQESSTGKIIGWTIIIVILLLLAWFYFRRYKGVSGISNLSRILGK